MLQKSNLENEKLEALLRYQDQLRDLIDDLLRSENDCREIYNKYLDVCNAIEKRLDM